MELKKFKDFVSVSESEEVKIYESESGPTVEVIKDFDGAFKGQVDAAIEYNKKKGIPMVHKVTVDSGPYRPYGMKYDRHDESDGTITCHLDFYSASRVFGYEFTTEDLADCIALKMKGSDVKGTKN